MKIPPVEGWQPTKVKHAVSIPTVNGKSVSETIEIDIDAWKDADGEIYLDDDARRKIESFKARRMGLLSSEEIRHIRLRLHTTQRAISELLQIGERTWTRWESGRERPSRSMNVLLSALRDGKIDFAYLETLKFGRSLASAWHPDVLASQSRPVVYQSTTEDAGSMIECVNWLFDAERLEQLPKPTPAVSGTGHTCAVKNLKAFVGRDSLHRSNIQWGHMSVHRSGGHKTLEKVRANLAELFSA